MLKRQSMEESVTAMLRRRCEGGRLTPVDEVHHIVPSLRAALMQGTNLMSLLLFLP